jgi:hypothetical protein
MQFYVSYSTSVRKNEKTIIYQYKLRTRSQSAWLREAVILEVFPNEVHLETKLVCWFHHRMTVLTKEKSDGIKYVSQYQLHGKSINAKTTSNPCQEAIDSSDQRQDG